MAEEASTPVAAEAPAPAVTADPTTHTVELPSSDAPIPKEDEDAAGPQATTEVTAPDGNGTTEVAEAPSSAPAANGDATPAASSKKEKRKSVGSAVPEHKSKKVNKKKSMPVLNLTCEPGQMFWARLKGYPPWPAVVCDEQMLPESLLASRPVSTARPDGTLREDFQAGGKNAKERTFPIMFLSTNEFTWMVNTALTPLDPEQCKVIPKSKMTKALTQAWNIAAEDHDLAYFKNVLKVWQEEQAEIDRQVREAEEQEAAEAEERAKQAELDKETAAAEEASKPKKKARKSKGGDGHVDMEDTDAPKSSKKRKKETESDGDKPKKTPKVTKLTNSKTPNGDTPAKKPAPKSAKKKVVKAPSEDEEDQKPQMTEAERLQTREKAVLYLRHRLQKGFLSRDQAPQESEMAGMADFFSQLEAYENLEPSIIRTTKIHKVLKAVVKLSSIPRDETFQFKKRSGALLELWNKRLEADGGPAAGSSSKAGAGEEKVEANGVKEDETSTTAAPPTSEAPKMESEDAEAKEGAAVEAAEPAKAEEVAEKVDEKAEEAVPAEEKMETAPEPPAGAAEMEAEKTKPAAVEDAMDTAADGEGPKDTEAAALVAENA